MKRSIYVLHPRTQRLHPLIHRLGRHIRVLWVHLQPLNVRVQPLDAWVQSPTSVLDGIAAWNRVAGRRIKLVL